MFQIKTNEEKYPNFEAKLQEVLPTLCVRCARCERERDTEREREREKERARDGSDVTIVVLKLAMGFALFLAKNCSFSIGEEFCTFPCQNLHLQ